MIKKICNLFIIVIFVYLVIGLIKFDRITIFACFVSLLLMIMTEILYKKFGFGDLLKFLIYIFIVGTEILGEVYHFYTRVGCFDIVMHIYSSFVISYMVYFMIKKYGNNLNKYLMMLFVFSFAMMTECMWELCEFSIDRLFDKDMQKDTIINKISSTYLSDSGDTPVTIYVDSVNVNDISFMDKYGGYIDIGLYDTISDMVCALIGSVLFIVIKKIVIDYFN